MQNKGEEQEKQLQQQSVDMPHEQHVERVDDQNTKIGFDSSFWSDVHPQGQNTKTRAELTQIKYDEDDATSGEKNILE